MAYGDVRNIKYFSNVIKRIIRAIIKDIRRHPNDPGERAIVLELLIGKGMDSEYWKCIYDPMLIPNIYVKFIGEDITIGFDQDGNYDDYDDNLLNANSRLSIKKRYRVTDDELRLFGIDCNIFKRRTQTETRLITK